MLRQCVLDQRAELDGPERHLQVLKTLAYLLVRQAKERPGSPVGEAQGAVCANHDARDRVGLQRKDLEAIVIGHRGPLLLALGRRHRVANILRQRLAEDSPLQLDWREQLAVREQ